jgi:16S rRNA (cytosine1402-N4)-methyltransferase
MTSSKWLSHTWESHNQPPSSVWVVTGSDLHTSVLLRESVDGLLWEMLVDGIAVSSTPRIYVDATAGLGGHSEYILSRLWALDRLIIIDRDPENLDLATARLQDSRVTPICGSFWDIADILNSLNIPLIDGILYDLGVSSVHYDDGERGFSIRENGPLDMRFNRHDMSLAPASEWIRHIDTRELFRGLQEYADEPKAYFIAEAIDAARKIAPITTTGELRAIIEAASFDPKSALRCFQAIRIMVNGELNEIEQSIPDAVSRLKLGGRLSIISFHSIEDRLIKNLARALEAPTIDEVTGQILARWTLKKIHKKPLEASTQEIAVNPRSRSAKLRVYEKI